MQEVVFGLALTHSSNTDTQNFATQFVKQKLTELIRSYIDIGKCSLVFSCNLNMEHAEYKLLLIIVSINSLQTQIEVTRKEACMIPLLNFSI